MAPSAGSFHVLVAKNVKILRLAAKKTSKFLQTVSITRPAPELQPVFARAAPRQPIHPFAFLRQSKRWFSGRSGFGPAVRRFTTSQAQEAGVRYGRASFPTSRVATAISQSTGRAPFASTLRPNLTGGTLGRTAGGYSLGTGRIGGARYFSHTPAQAQVISNVSQAVRAFFIGGKKAQYDGVDPRTGEKRYRAVTALQDEAIKKMDAVPKATPGSYIDYSVNPTITALTPLSTVPGFSARPRKMETLNTEGLLDVLSVDFSRALKELATILNDLKRLSALGDLPITYQNSYLRVHFPGCDADTVERLALELGLQRGIIGQDAEFDAFAGTEIALLFPFAPSKSPSECLFFEKSVNNRLCEPEVYDWRNEPSPESFASPDFSTRSNRSDDVMDYDVIEDNPWISSPSGYESLHSSELDDSGRYYDRHSESRHTPLEYQGMEGIYRFIEQCDAAARH